MPLANQANLRFSFFNSHFIMSSFWPNRDNPKGFSIETLAKKYRQKINNASNTTIQDLPDSLGGSNPKKNISRIHQKESLTHWANRDFREEYNVA